MKFLDLAREYRDVDWQVELGKVFADQSFINGPKVKEFETAVAKAIGVQYAVGVSSGTDALMVALMALELKPGATVLTTPYTFIATTEVPFRLGCRIRFCDIDDFFNIDLTKAKEIIASEHIDVFLPVHLFGQPVALDDEIIRLCYSRGTRIVEDAAQAFGASVLGKQVGNIGDLGCFSFFPAKNLGCAGDGGLVTTNNKDLYEKCVTIRNHGSKVKYEHERHGGNFRLDTVQAALLLAKLPHVGKWLADRSKHARLFNRELFELVDIPLTHTSVVHSYNQYVVRVREQDRNELAAFLKGKGVPTAIYYPKSLCEQPCYQGIDFGPVCSKSRQAAKENIALPIAYLTEEEEQAIITSIKEFYCR